MFYLIILIALKKLPENQEKIILKTNREYKVIEYNVYFVFLTNVIEYGYDS